MHPKELNNFNLVCCIHCQPNVHCKYSLCYSSNKEVVQQAVIELLDRNVYESVNVGPDRTITQYGPLDERMGTSSKIKRCKTCTEELNRCNGHYGYIKLALPAFHIGYVKRLVEILQCICKVSHFSRLFLMKRC